MNEEINDEDDVSKEFEKNIENYLESFLKGLFPTEKHEVTWCIKTDTSDPLRLDRFLTVEVKGENEEEPMFVKIHGHRRTLKH